MKKNCTEDGPTLRIHFGRPRPSKTHAAIANVIMAANAANAARQKNGHMNGNGHSASDTCLTASETKVPNQQYGDAKTTLLTTDSNTSRKRTGVREKSRQMMKYMHEQRAARTLSIVVGAFILCWMPFFIMSPILVLCESCVADPEFVFSIITWAGHLNSMLNPLIYSRFSRDFRKAFKQILTCQRDRKRGEGIRTPLNMVFTQLVAITQSWDQHNTTECDIDVSL
ncbi:CBN-DOP-4 protein [Aphelenchoides avenae]|nr:CBN-DOP-4 protein [Aphelenchus avenae]KAH7716033.1 CBN-DOP-4 protein [Aphelenchus avenae]